MAIAGHCAACAAIGEQETFCGVTTFIGGDTRAA